MYQARATIVARNLTLRIYTNTLYIGAQFGGIIELRLSLLELTGEVIEIMVLKT